jgi:hypothetical protein
MEDVYPHYFEISDDDEPASRHGVLAKVGMVRVWLVIQKEILN